MFTFHQTPEILRFAQNDGNSWGFQVHLFHVRSSEQGLYTRRYEECFFLDGNF